VAIALAAVAASCRTTTPAPQLSPRAVVLATPLVEQDELYQCGFAAVSALCQFYGVEIPAELRKELIATAAARHGLSGDELRVALSRVGLETYLFSGTLDDGPTGLVHHVDLGRPLIVMTSERDTQHYVLFIGHDPELGQVVLLDPVRGQVVLPNSSFLRLWEPASRFTLLAVPKASADAGPSNVRTQR
jgi:ABC-type bacteriocin/lantibiotic exporter with double-glycine peptidase domain